MNRSQMTEHDSWGPAGGGMPPQPGWRHLLVLFLGVVAVLTGVLGTAPSARADGLDLSCSTGGGSDAELDPGTEPQVLDGVDVVFRGRAASTVPVTGAVEIEPETGDKVFTRTWRPTSGGTFYVDFLDSAGPEMSFSLRPRVHAGWGGPVPFSLGLQDLLTQNYELPNDYRRNPLLPPDTVGVAGLDMTGLASAALAALPEGIEGRLEVHVRFRRTDGTWFTTRISAGIDSRAPGADMPRQTDIGVAFKRVYTGGAGTPTDYVLVGQHFTSWAEGSPKPGIGVRVDVDEVLGETSTPVVDVDLDYSNVPENMAVGVRSRCRPWDPAFESTGHVAWNHSGLTPEAAAATSLDLKIRSGVGKGLPIRISEFDPILGGSTRDVQADEVDLDARVVGLPERLDWIMHPDSMGITRSSDVTPDMVLNHLALAQDDPAVTIDKPMYVEGSVPDVPQHTRVQAGFGADGGITDLDLRFYSATCDSGTPEDDLFPPGPQGCRRDAPVAVPDATMSVQNWLPQDLVAQAAWTGMAAPPIRQDQYLYYESRDFAAGVPVGLWRMGARIVGLRRVTYDAVDPAHVKIYADRDESYVQPPEPTEPPGDCVPTHFPPECTPLPWPIPVFVDPDPAHFVIDVDARTSDDEVANAGTRVQAAGKVPDLPEALRLDLETGQTATKARWWASSSIELHDGSIHVVLPGPSATHVDAALRVGRSGQGLPASGEVSIEEEGHTLSTGGWCIFVFGRRVCIVPPRDIWLPSGWSHVAYTTLGMPDDGFPTPSVPETASDSARVRAGAVITSSEERLAFTRLRMWVDADIAPGARVRWYEGDGSVAHVTAELCEDPAACPANRFDGTVVAGPPLPHELDSLIERPDLPVIPTAVAEVMPAFSDEWWWAEEAGVRAILTGDGAWGINAFVRNVAGFDYFTDGAGETDVSVVMANGAATAEQPFNVDLLDASRTREVALGGGHIPLMVDARLDRLPQQMRVRIDAAEPAGADAPLVWVNTEDVDIADHSEVDWDDTDGADDARPHLTGVVRLGDVDILRQLPAAARPTAARSERGADVWAHFSLGNGLFGVDVVADLDVPRHVALWQPTTEECNAGQDRDRIAACQGRPLHEMDEWQKVGLAAKTTSESLGDLKFDGRLVDTGLDFDVNGAVESVPGRLDADVTLTQNRRLPWTSVTLDLDANVSLGSVWATVDDNTLAAQSNYRRADGSTRETPTYALYLENVANRLHADARIFGMESRLSPPTPDSNLDPGRLGFVHALLDLHGRATDIDVDVRAGQVMTGVLESHDYPVSGWLNARMDGVAFSTNMIQGDSPFARYFTGGGLFGAITGDWGWGFVGQGFLTWPFDLILFGPFIDLFLPNSAVLDVTLEFDLPILVNFASVSELRFGVNGTTLSIDQTPRTLSPTAVSIRQALLPNETYEWMPGGAWFHRRDVHFYTTDGVFETFDIREQDTNEFGSIGLHPWQLCHDKHAAGDANDVACYSGSLSRTNVGWAPDFPTTHRGGSYTSADVIIDPLFSPESRAELQRQDGSLVKPGVALYGVLADLFPPADHDAFLFPELTASSTRTASWTVSASSCDPDAQLMPEVGARTPDGTLIGVDSVCEDPEAAGGTLRGLALGAEFANGVPRWLVTAPLPAGVNSDGTASCQNGTFTCRVRTSLVPRTDGSVQVTITTERRVQLGSFTYWSTLGTSRAWYDASGHPGDDLVGSAQVTTFSVPALSDSTLTRSGAVTLDACRIATWACTAPASGNTTRWVFGDGAISDPVGGAPGTVLHDYPSTRTRAGFFGTLVELDAAGDVVRTAPFTVNTGGFALLDGGWWFPFGP